MLRSVETGAGEPCGSLLLMQDEPPALEKAVQSLRGTRHEGTLRAPRRIGMSTEGRHKAFRASITDDNDSSIRLEGGSWDGH